MNSIEGEDIYSHLLNFFDVYDLQVTPQGYTFFFHNMYAPFEEIRESFEKKGYFIFLRKKEDKKMGLLLKTPPPTKEITYLPLILLALTFLTTTWAGWIRSQELVKLGYLSTPIVGALSFSLSLLFILGSHELGHKITSIKHKIRSSGPFFIPLPPFIFPLGTMGAVIKMKSPVPDRNASVRLGASGPITGFILSIPILIVGLKLSYVVEPLKIVKGKEVIVFGEPLLFIILKKLLLNISPDKALLLHPLAFSGWVGLFVTALNLIPLGQLDGGHILRAIVGPENFRRISGIIIGLLFLCGLLLWEGWLIWAFLGLFFTLGGNPGALNELEGVGKREKCIAIFTCLIFILTFIPTPVQIIQIK